MSKIYVTLRGPADKVFYKSTQVYPEVFLSSEYDSVARVYTLRFEGMCTYTDFNGYTGRGYIMPFPVAAKFKQGGVILKSMSGEFPSTHNKNYEGRFPSTGWINPFDQVMSVIIPVEDDGTIPDITFEFSMTKDYTAPEGTEYHYSSVILPTKLNSIRNGFLADIAKTPTLTSVDITPVNYSGEQCQFSITANGDNITDKTSWKIVIASYTYTGTGTPRVSLTGFIPLARSQTFNITTINSSGVGDNINHATYTYQTTIDLSLPKVKNVTVSYNEGSGTTGTISFTNATEYYTSVIHSFDRKIDLAPNGEEGSTKTLAFDLNVDSENFSYILERVTPEVSIIRSIRLMSSHSIVIPKLFTISKIEIIGNILKLFKISFPKDTLTLGIYSDAEQSPGSKVTEIVLNRHHKNKNIYVQLDKYIYSQLYFKDETSGYTISFEGNFGNKSNSYMYLSGIGWRLGNMYVYTANGFEAVTAEISK